MGTALKIVGWFFGIIIFLFGLIIFASVLFRIEHLSGPLLGGLLIMLIGILACYGGSRSGRKKDLRYYEGTSSSSMNVEDMKREKIEKKKKNDTIMDRAKKDWTDQPLTTASNKNSTSYIQFDKMVKLKRSEDVCLYLGYFFPYFQ